MQIKGIDGLTPEQVVSEVERGGRFVIYQYCFSVLIMTFKRGTDVYFVRAGENSVVKGLPWTLLSLCVGWWGFPWGVIYTPMVLFTNLRGGSDVTADLLPRFQAQAASQPPGAWPPPPAPLPPGASGDPEPPRWARR